MLLRRRGLTGQRYDLVDADGGVVRIRLRPLRQGGTVTALDGSGWRIDRDPGFGAWRTCAIAADSDLSGDTLVTVEKGVSRERYELTWDGGHLVLVRRRGWHRRRMELLDGRGAVLGEVVRASMWTGTYELRFAPVPPAVTATVGFLVVLLNRRDTSATWS